MPARRDNDLTGIEAKFLRCTSLYVGRSQRRKIDRPMTDDVTDSEFEYVQYDVVTFSITREWDASLSVLLACSAQPPSPCQQIG
jgi:hypothetical protein